MISLWEDYKGDSKDWNEFMYNNEAQFRQTYEWGECKKDLGWDVIRLIKKVDGRTVLKVQIIIRYFLYTANCYIPGGIVGDLGYFDKSFFLIVKKKCSSPFIYIRSDFVKPYEGKDKKVLEETSWKKPIYALNSEKFIYLDLNKSNEEILRDAKPQWRRHHKIGSKNGLKIKYIENPNPGDFNFIQDHLSTKYNTRNYNSIREMSVILKYFNKNYIVFSAFDSGNNILASRGIVICKNIAWHQYSGVIEEGRNLKAGFPLLHHVLDKCRSLGVRKFNLGEVNMKSWPGPGRFKTGSDRNANLYDTLGEWEWSNNVLLSLLLNFYIKFYHSTGYYLSKKFWKNL
tara:strand:- start:910 stop:1938 length:1029 start_codon:yes stop_codon:yes gene_type:complete